MNATHRVGESDPARKRGEGPRVRLDRAQVIMLHREARAGRIDIDGALAAIEERQAIPDDVRHFVRATLVEGISPHTKKDGRPRGEIIRDANILIDEISFYLAEKKFGSKYSGTKLADYHTGEEQGASAIDSDFDEA